MANYSQTQQKLSPRMRQLKKELENRALLNISLLEEVHRGSTLVSNITGFINHLFNIISSAMSVAAKAIPVVGAVIQLASVIPKAIAILTDPKKSIPEKIVSAILIATLVALSITAFALGSVAALIIGTVIASIVTVVDSLGFMGKIFEKYKISQASNQKKELNALLAQRIIPESDKFNDELEIRAVELEHKVNNSKVNNDEKNRLVEELEFINSILKQKNIIAGSNPQSPAFKLKEHYIKRQEQINEFTNKIAAVESAKDPVQKKKCLDEILAIQKDLLVTEGKIEALTKSLETLKSEGVDANAGIALSGATAALSAAGAIISILALVLIVGGIAAPQVAIPIIVGLGIGLAVLGFIKFMGEKLVEMEMNRRKENKSTVLKENVMNEALNAYSNQNSNKQMQELLITSEHSANEKPVIEETKSLPEAEIQSFPALFQEHKAEPKPETKPVPESISLG